MERPNLFGPLLCILIGTALSLFQGRKFVRSLVLTSCHWATIVALIALGTFLQNAIVFLFTSHASLLTAVATLPSYYSEQFKWNSFSTYFDTLGQDSLLPASATLIFASIATPGKGKVIATFIAFFVSQSILDKLNYRSFDLSILLIAFACNAVGGLILGLIASYVYDCLGSVHSAGDLQALLGGIIKPVVWVIISLAIFAVWRVPVGVNININGYKELMLVNPCVIRVSSNQGIMGFFITREEQITAVSNGDLSINLTFPSLPNKVHSPVLLYTRGIDPSDDQMWETYSKAKLMSLSEAKTISFPDRLEFDQSRNSAVTLRPVGGTKTNEFLSLAGNGTIDLRSLVPNTSGPRVMITLTSTDMALTLANRNMLGVRRSLLDDRRDDAEGPQVLTFADLSDSITRAPNSPLGRLKAVTGNRTTLLDPFTLDSLLRLSVDEPCEVHLSGLEELSYIAPDDGDPFAVAEEVTCDGIEFDASGGVMRVGLSPDIGIHANDRILARSGGMPFTIKRSSDHQLTVTGKAIEVRLNGEAINNTLLGGIGESPGHLIVTILLIVFGWNQQKLVNWYSRLKGRLSQKEG